MSMSWPKGLERVSVVPEIFALELEDADSLNRRLLADFDTHAGDPDICRSHYFGGRCENVYIPPSKVPAIRRVLDAAVAAAAAILGTAPESLRAGFWFNEMGPGHTTTLHTHDDDDELLSAAYYVRVPPASGDFIAHNGSGRVQIAPRPGQMLLFRPDMPHEVAVNQSGERRLSVGINVGPGDSSSWGEASA
ncbi:MAG TPA: hypothetical protein ENJ05_00145 [Thiotrichales bacterium]|nr:hypothetical protein [Thiotrichales bacterium]